MSNDKAAVQLAAVQHGPQGLLSIEQMGRVQGAVADLQPQQLIWLSGYFAGLSGQGLAPGAAPATPAAEAAPGATITVLYGSQTGNAHGVAKRLHAHLTSNGATAKLVDMEDYNPRHLKNETHIALVVSTQGEGDPPDGARGFLEFVQGKKAPKLDKLTFSVMGLGDSSYEFYCKTGKDFDERLAELGASRAADRIDADIDYQAETEQWLEQWQAYWNDNLAAAGGSATAAAPVLSVVAESAYDKFSPFTAEVIDNFPITGEGTDKNILHVEVSLEDSGLTYQAGDALGIWHINDEALVDEILEQTQLDGAAEITVNKEAKSLRDALINDREITLMHPKLVEYLVENSGENDNRLVWKGLVEGERAEFLAAIYKYQVVEVLAEMPHAWQPQELFDQLRPLTPRLYSIASSQAAVDEEVHITVREVVEERQGKKRFGGASHFLATLPEDAELKVFIEHNKHFHLPESDNTPVIMVGAGTGVAPYRGFMQQREESGAEGDNWLFFGNSNARYEFLYQTEWQNWHKSGLLTNIDLAFSRDQAERIYVQDRLRQQGDEIFAWLEKGAHFYVCGDKNAMAKAVEQALIDIIAGQNDKGVEFAKAYLDDLQRDGRYQKDVY